MEAVVGPIHLLELCVDEFCKKFNRHGLGTIAVQLREVRINDTGK